MAITTAVKPPEYYWGATLNDPVQWTTTATTTGTSVNTGTGTTFKFHEPSEAAPQIRGMDELSHEVFNLPKEALENMWVARFGYGFIPYEAIEYDDFFRLAACRLMNLHMMEWYVTSSKWVGRVSPE